MMLQSPRPLQRPRIPVAGPRRAQGKVKPLHEAARYDGVFPVSLDGVDEFAQAGVVRELRGGTRRLMTSPSSFVPATMSPPTPKPAPPGG